MCTLSNNFKAQFKNMKQFLLSLLLLGGIAYGQTKQPLDHSVYDNWKSVGERYISNDGNYVVYAINAQEGDGAMLIRNLNTGYELQVNRGYNAVITEDSRYAIFRIKPSYEQTRQAKIKKKKPDDMPKDSLAIITLGRDSVTKVSRVKSYKTPEKGSGWLAYLMEKSAPDSAVKKRHVPDSIKARVDMLTKLADSLIRRSLDSIKGKIEKEEVIAAAKKAVKEIYKKADELEMLQLEDAEGDDAASAGGAKEGTDLVLQNLGNNSSITFKLVADYQFDKFGKRLLIETTKNKKDSNSIGMLLLYNLQEGKTDTIMRGLNEAANFSFDETGNQLAFVAERDSGSKALQKFYKLWYYQQGADSAVLAADKNTPGMHLGNTVSENGKIEFSKDGQKLFFQVAPVQPPKDTTLVDFELARLDVWHYNDDYLQPQQLKQLPRELKRSYTTVLLPGNKEVVQLADAEVEDITLVDEGNADWVLGETTRGNRISLQWEGRQVTTAYIINTRNGRKTKIDNKSYGNYSASPDGQYVYWYDPAAKQYFTFNVDNGTTKNISSKITVPLYDTENDVPDYPRPAGVMGWMKNDQYVLIQDEYDAWLVDPNALEPPVNITNSYGRTNKIAFDYVKLDKEQRFFQPGESIMLKGQQKQNKEAGYFSTVIDKKANPKKIGMGAYAINSIIKADDAAVYLVQQSTPAASELYYGSNFANLRQITTVAEQQKDVNWFSTELVRWKMFDGKMSEGILFKPENFDPKKKYPVIFYFYERNADGLYNYRAPAPSASTINIPYFTSNGYIVFDPNIYYKDGEPGESAYNSIVSAAKYLSKMPWVDSTRMAIQGQSWGGYQVAYLVTRTNIFRAAGAGAPVSNMTSAYGGIRWGSGLNRQFQYEKSQSRIGATLWERPDLYIKNSPLFAVPKIKTPLLLMHNDEDGAVPWYQGIEMFTAMKRLGKKVWLLQYNGEDHNLVQRKNRKDLSVRLAQFFDYYLKDAPPAQWIKEGLPATEKGRSWGLDY